MLHFCHIFLLAALLRFELSPHRMSDSIPKRKFLLTSAGAAFAVLMGGVGAWGQAIALRLRAISSSGRNAPGLQKRLLKIRVVRVEEAFKLANRRAEIEVTR